MENLTNSTNPSETDNKTDYFSFMTETSALKSFCVLFSVMGIILGPLALYSIIWFERFGSDKKRTLLNMLFSMICWTCIGFCLCIQVIDAHRGRGDGGDETAPPREIFEKLGIKNAIETKNKCTPKAIFTDHFDNPSPPGFWKKLQPPPPVF